MTIEVRHELRAVLDAYMHQKKAELDVHQLCKLTGIAPVPRTKEGQVSAVALLASRALPRYDSRELEIWRIAIGTDQAITAAVEAELWTSADAVAHSAS